MADEILEPTVDAPTEGEEIKDDGETEEVV